MNRTICRRRSEKQKRRLVKKKVLQNMNLIDLECNTSNRNNKGPIISEPSNINIEEPTSSHFSWANQIKMSQVQIPEKLDENEYSVSIPTNSTTESEYCFVRSPFNVNSLQQKEISLEKASKSSVDSLTFLRNWGKKNKISHVAMSELLKWLKDEGCCYKNLPKDARTLYQTPKSSEIETFDNGKFYYFGLKNGLSKIDFGNNCKEINLYFNVDGLPLHKSTKQQFWPILCRVDHFKSERPFIVALFLGEKKPPLDYYFHKFIDELKIIMEFGFTVKNKHIEVNVKAFCCDTPARCFIKSVKNHNSYEGCDRCLVRGEYINHRMTFCNVLAELRTDELFRNKESLNHHRAHPSPLERLPIDMINDFPNDYMHSVCLGIVRKILFIWRDKGRAYGIKKIHEININILRLRSFWPVDFNRKPRTFSDLENWKATEFRQFLLYVGPIVLRNVIPNYLFCNFMLLSYGISILINEDLNKNYNKYAEDLLSLFIKHSIKIYGKEFCIYNTHSLIHLPSDARVFGSLGKINCFAFENFLGSLKKMLRKPNLPLEQVVRRYQELGDPEHSISNRGAFYVLDSIEYSQGLTMIMCEDIISKVANHDFYSKLYFKTYFFSNKLGNNCVFLKNGDILKIILFSDYKGSIFIVGYQLNIIKSLLDYPTSSTLLGKYEVSINEHFQVMYETDNILHKGVLISTPDGTSICFPLLHVMD